HPGGHPRLIQSEDDGGQVASYQAPSELFVERYLFSRIPAAMISLGMPFTDKPPAPPASEPAVAPESDVAPKTAWHPMLVKLLEVYLPEGYQLIAEFLLARQSQRVDIVVIRKVDVDLGPVKKLHSILDYLRAHTLIEHKGPTDDLAAEDLLTLLAYAF